jgi:hypothetical protein
MNRRSTSSLGALHPVLFFLCIYGISLVLAIFVCRTVYFSINSESPSTSQEVMKASLGYSSASNATALK